MNNQTDSIETKNITAKNKLKFSPAKRHIARFIMYLGVIFSVILLFLPILQIQEKETIGDTEFKYILAISPVQYMTGDTVVKPAIIGGTSEENDFLEMFLPEIDMIEIIQEGSNFGSDFQEFLKYIFIFSICFGIFITVVNIPREIKKSKYEKNRYSVELNGARSKIRSHDSYFRSIYNLPYIASWLSPVPLAPLCCAIISFFMQAKSSNIENVNYVLPIVLFLLTISCASGTVSEIILFKEKIYISKDNFRFDDNEVNKFLNPKNKFSNADELYKYKKLLDDGIITEEEYQKQKEKILNSQNN